MNFKNKSTFDMKLLIMFIFSIFVKRKDKNLYLEQLKSPCLQFLYEGMLNHSDINKFYFWV